MKLEKLKVILLMFAVLAFTGCSSKKMYDMAMAYEQSSAGLEKKFITLDFGEMVYLENDVKSDVTLVLIHGFGGDKDNWNRMVKHLDDKYHVLVPDLPGHGESVATLGLGYTTTEQAQRFGAFLKAKKIKNFHIVGHSMGGAIALRYVKENTDNVTSLILIDAMGMHKTKSLGDILVEQSELNPLYDVCTKERLETLLNYSMYKMPYIPEIFKDVMLAQKCEKKALEREMYADMFTDVKLDALAKSITVPTLILWGEKDGIIDVDNAKLFHDAIKNSQLRIFKELGHVPILEDPEKTAKVIDGFIGHYK